jgi:hypothetical protein
LWQLGLGRDSFLLLSRERTTPDGEPAPTIPRADPDAAAIHLAQHFGLPVHVFRPIVRSALRPRRSPVLDAAWAAARSRSNQPTEPP